MEPVKLGANRWRDPRRTMETAFFNNAMRMRERLNSYSPSLCLAKWLQLSVHLTTGRTQSCYHPPTHKIPLKEIEKHPSALHNTAYKGEQRRLMLNGKRPSECQYCWAIEDAPGDHLSDRHYRSAEIWSEPHFEEVLKAGHTGHINPRAVEVNFSSACQLKCSYCSPHISSAWLEDVRRNGPFPILGGKHNDLAYFESAGLLPMSRSEDNPYARAFWDWWPDLYKDLSVFRMTGGEPLMDHNTYKVLDYILQHPKPDLSLAITSNFSVRDEYMEKFMVRSRRLANGRFIEKFQLYVSCDSVGQQAEYIRPGLDYEKFIGNVDRFLSEVTMSTVTFIVTFNNLSVVGWPRLLDQILELRRRHSRYSQRVFFDTPLLRDPEWLSVQILPERYRQILTSGIAEMQRQKASFESVESRFHRVLDYEIARMERNLAWMSQTLDEARIRRARASFHIFFSEQNRRRGTNFVATFPEMEDFWQMCGQARQECEG